MRLSSLMNGLKDFAEALCANVAKEKWRQAEGEVNLLLRAEDSRTRSR